MRKHHRIGRFIRDPCRGVGVLLTRGLRGHEPIAESACELTYDDVERSNVAATRVVVCHFHSKHPS
jgi:hypothetical protein